MSQETTVVKQKYKQNSVWLVGTHGHMTQIHKFLWNALCDFLSYFIKAPFAQDNIYDLAQLHLVISGVTALDWQAIDIYTVIPDPWRLPFESGDCGWVGRCCSTGQRFAFVRDEPKQL